VSQDAVRRVLGLVDEERYLELLGILAERRHGEVFSFLESLLDEGYDLTEFYHGWVDMLRVLLRARLSGAAPDVREDLVDAFAARLAAFAPADLVRMLSLASELESNGSLRRSSQPRLLLEMLLLRLSYLDHTVELEELIQGLGGAPGGAEPSMPSRGSTQGGPAGPASGKRASAVSTPTAATSNEGMPPKPAPAAGREATLRTNDLGEAWQSVIASGKGVAAGMGLFLRGASLFEESPGTVRVTLPEGPVRERFHDPVVRRPLADALSERLGRSVDLTLDEGAGERAPTPSRISQDEVRQGRLRELVAREPLLERAVKELDLELLE
jgi:hypothetical protein